jgi:hypothetical protein
MPEQLSIDGRPAVPGRLAERRCFKRGLYCPPRCTATTPAECVRPNDPPLFEVTPLFVAVASIRGQPALETDDPVEGDGQCPT